MPNPDPDAKQRKRDQARQRMQKLRKKNKDLEGDMISGLISESESNDLEEILRFRKKSDPQASKIGAVRWAIQYVADALREGKIK